VRRATWLLLAASAASSCRSAPPDLPGDEIVVCGDRYPIGVPVVLWSDPGGYSAYRLEPRFPDEPGTKAKPGPRFGDRDGRPASGWTLESLQDRVDQFVLHYDVAGTARQCFKVLQDVRALSVHFLLDVDGTIYQTLDLEARAWHATKANHRSIGIEIANIGAYPRAEHRVLHEWYGSDADGPFVRFPAWMKVTGVRSQGFTARPARRELIEGNVQGKDLWQYDFTEEQYQSLVKLTAALARILPRIQLEAPRATDGRVLPRVMDAAAFDAWRGVLGHWHVQENKTDPGPALDWERLLREARAVVGVEPRGQ
jgi:N-acetyl-anhydromuramyl-L-alanine amidase AmpD